MQFPSLIQMDTEARAYELEQEAKAALDYLIENCLSTITPDQFGKLPEPQKLIFQNRIQKLRKLEEIITKLSFLACYESVTYRTKKENLKSIINSL